MLPKELLESYINNFVGYGELSSSIWFIGMEEGGGTNEAEIRARLTAWDRRGRQKTEDLAMFHKEFGQYDRFERNASLQSTWAKLIRVLLKRKGIDPTTPLLKQFQKDELGRKAGDMALLELLPLPKPARNQWPYNDWSDLPELQSIGQYEAAILPNRIAAIRGLVAQHKPATVLFYGMGFKEHWSAICGMPFKGEGFPQMAEDDDTLFMLLPHPVAHGRVAAHYDAAGDLLHQRMLAGA